MSSTGSSPPSSWTERERRLARPYQGPEYLEAVGLPLDPLVHLDPYAPPMLYRLVLAGGAWLIRHLFRFEVVGAENVPPPPYLIASNHQAWFDALFVAAAFPRRPMIYIMARRDTVFNRVWKRRLVPNLGVFPIQPYQGELDRAGTQVVYQLMGRGATVLMFPEGHYSHGRAIRPLRKGVAHFALQAGVPIVPVAILNVDRLRLFGRVRVSIGAPVWPDPPRWWDLNRRVGRMLLNVQRAIVTAFGPEPRERPRAGAGGWRDRFPGRRPPT